MSLSQYSSFNKKRWALPCLLLMVFAAVTLPFWMVPLPPAADLPQHLAQIFLLEQTLDGNRAELVLTPWYYPNTLVYWLLYVFWQFADPLTCGRLILSVLAAAWVGGAYLLCRKFERPLESWLLGVPLVFNFMFTWGFLNFLIGWPLFCLFLTIWSRPLLRQRSVWIVVLAFLLYSAHALWFLMATVWVGICALQQREKGFWSQIWPLVPVWALALAWYPQLVSGRKSSSNIQPEWGLPLYQRFDFSHLSDAMLGSIFSDIESIFCMLLGLWLAGVLATRWRELPKLVSRPMMAAAILLLSAYALLPDTYMDTLHFNQRWLPCGIVLLLLALPVPKIPKGGQVFSWYVGGLALGIICIFSVVTIRYWQLWADEELDGFIEAMDRVGRVERVVGLNFYGNTVMKGQPGLQLIAYAQALKGAEIQFSFTQHYTGVVQYKPGVHVAQYSVWFPVVMTRAQLRRFDWVLVNGDEHMQTFARNRWGLVPADDGKHMWRLYRPDSWGSLAQ